MAGNPFGKDGNDPFAKARERFGKAPTSFEKITDYEGRLLLITPTAFTQAIETSFGEADAVTADVAVLDGEGAPVELGGVMIFQKVLIGQLRGQIGKRPVLGVLSKRKTQKAGRSDAWFLDSDAVDDAAVKLAVEYLDNKDKDRVAAAPKA